jgi:DNA-directed RNA polymerase specialized sigma24 family protein
MMSEQELAEQLGRAKSGDAGSLGRLCEEARVRLQLVIKYRLRGWSEADREDLIQDTLVTFCEKIAAVDRTPMAFALWILRQKIGNTLQKGYRNRERSFSRALPETGDGHADSVLDPPDPGDDPATAYDRKETMQKVLEAMSLLNEFCRTVFTGLLEGLRIQEIWEHYREIEPGLQRGAFDKRTHVCRRKLFALVGGLE